MVKYKNLSGNSGILGYEISINSIKVYFLDGGIYLYTINSAGSINIENMKILANKGEGLNSFINIHVKYKYVK